MDLSTYDNVATPPPSNIIVTEAIQLVVSDIFNAIRSSDPVLYCPFCILSFADNNSLDIHLKYGHLTFLHELLTRSISLDKCPFCSAKFFSHHLVARHALTYHSYVLFETFFKKVRSKVQCLFCHIVVEKSAMTHHVGSLHTIDFNEWFIARFCVKYSGVAGLVEITVPNTVPNTMDVEDLNEKLKGLKVLSPGKPKSILKIEDKKFPSNSLKPSVRRELRFEEDKENAPTPRNLRSNKRSPKDGIRKSTRERSSSVCSWNSALRNSCFQCGKCSISFSSHTQLVVHVKKEHKKLSLNILQPFYQCALCGARFYKSSYLKKHSSVHSLTKLR